MNCENKCAKAYDIINILSRKASQVPKPVSITWSIVKLMKHNKIVYERLFMSRTYGRSWRLCLLINISLKKTGSKTMRNIDKRPFDNDNHKWHCIAIKSERNIMSKFMNHLLFKTKKIIKQWKCSLWNVCDNKKLKPLMNLLQEKLTF